MPEPESALVLKTWLRTNGGEFHQDATYTEDDCGFRIVASKDIPADSRIVSCPADLIITPETSRKSILEILGDPTEKTLHWVERQWIATYLTLHWIIEKHKRKAPPDYLELNHTLYLNTLPAPEKLRTPLHFTSSELALFQGSNLHGATIDRERDWRKEWEDCQNIVSESDTTWGKEYTWEKYLTAATYISSRSFTSSLLSAVPNLGHDPDSYPILIPGVDSLNHARAHPVSWVVSGKKDYNDQGYAVAIVHHIAVVKGQELHNNYGPKPNAELVLGYGFSLPNNPDDTIVLKLGGFKGQRWEIGRDARNAGNLWLEILSNSLGPEMGEPTYEDILEAALSLQDMTEKLLGRLPQRNIPESLAARPEVVEMFHNYIDGQRDILNSLLHFARQRESEAVDLARQNGIELVLEND